MAKLNSLTKNELISMVKTLQAQAENDAAELEARRVTILALREKHEGVSKTKVAPTIVAKDYAPKHGKTTATTWLATLFNKIAAYKYREACCRKAAELGLSDTFAVKSGPKGTFSVLRYEH